MNFKFKYFLLQNISNNRSAKRLVKIELFPAINITIWGPFRNCTIQFLEFANLIWNRTVCVELHIKKPWSS